MPTILCVDDSPKTLRLLTSVLQSCGYRVLTAGDPNAALRVAAINHFDLAILDYQLPNWSGAYLAKAIKRLKPDVPIMLLSGALSLATDELNDVDEIVHKGESVNVMLHKVRGLLGQSTASALRGRASEHARGEELPCQTTGSSQSSGDVERQTVDFEQRPTLISRLFGLVHERS